MRITREEYIGFLPSNRRKVTAKGCDAVFYLYETQGAPAACCFLGKAQKPTWRFRFGSDAARAKHIASAIEGRTAAEARTKARRAERNAPHGLEKGVILNTSWGYDQTNVEFYEVVDVPSPCYVVLQEIGQQTANDAPDGYSSMSDHRMPDPENKIGAPFRRKVDMCGKDPSITISSCQRATLWNGKPAYVSWYA